MHLKRTFSSESIYLYEHKPIITCSPKNTSNPSIGFQLRVPYKVKLEIEVVEQIIQIVELESMKAFYT